MMFLQSRAQMLGSKAPVQGAVLRFFAYSAGSLLSVPNVRAGSGAKYILITDSRHECQVRVNLVARMTLTEIKRLWVADITYIRLRTEFVYLAVVIDRFSREIPSAGLWIVPWLPEWRWRPSSRH